MGTCLARLLKGSCQVTLCGRDPSRAAKVARRLGILSSGTQECVGSNDVVIAAIPTAVLKPFVGQISTVIPSGSLFTDISSVKCGVIEDIAKLLPTKVEYASIHPLFASARLGVKNIVFIPVRGSTQSSRLRQLLASAGMHVVESNAEEHDRIMAVVQVLHHFGLLALREALARMNNGSLDGFETYSFRRSLSVLKLIEGNLETVEFIQRSNRFAPRAREVFIEESMKLSRNYNGGSQDH